MIPTLLQALVQRELDAARRTVEAYPDENSLWIEKPGLPNTGGNLVLHIAGNLQHFYGAVIGKTGYVRNRDAEFARRNVPRDELLAEIDAAKDAVDRTIALLDEQTLASRYPLEVGGRAVNTGDFLVHLASHLAYHLGQLDYHRRLVTGDRAGVNALGLAALPPAS